jgi:hypothetical protein
MFQRLIDDFFKKMERDAEHEELEEFEDSYARYFEAPEPPQWPRSRSFKPPLAKIIPTGAYKTFSPCQAMTDDFGDLSWAIGHLENELRQRPPNKRKVSESLNNVTSLAKHIRSRLKNGFYVKQRCNKHDMKLFALSVRVMLQRGKNLPPRARQSLQGLLN